MADKKPTLELWSVAEGKLVEFEFSIDNDEIVATTEHETIKFPGGINKEELLKLVKAHNEANDGIKALTDEQLQEQKDLVQANEQLLKDLL